VRFILGEFPSVGVLSVLVNTKIVNVALFVEGLATMFM
jgi:hypothetical protein